MHCAPKWVNEIWNPFKFWETFIASTRDFIFLIRHVILRRKLSRQTWLDLTWVSFGILVKLDFLLELELRGYCIVFSGSSTCAAIDTCCVVSPLKRLNDIISSFEVKLCNNVAIYVAIFMLSFVFATAIGCWFSIYVGKGNTWIVGYSIFSRKYEQQHQ